MFIRIHSDPEPLSREPSYVKEAYVGLVLEIEHKMDPCTPYPSGCYLVGLGEFLSRLKAHNLAAFEWQAQQWGSLAEALDACDHVIKLTFRAECCTEWGNEAVQ